jgi:hypothetical protein
MSDAIDKAIGTTPAPPPRAGVVARASSGREFLINAPADMTLQDALELVSFISTGALGEEIAKATRPPSRLVAVRGSLPPQPIRRT